MSNVCENMIDSLFICNHKKFLITHRQSYIVTDTSRSVYLAEKYDKGSHIDLKTVKVASQFYTFIVEGIKVSYYAKNVHLLLQYIYVTNLSNLVLHVTS